MKRHIKVRAMLVPPLFNEVELTIVEQSHKCDNFGDPHEWDTNEFYATNGIAIKSCARPEWDGCTLYVKGHADWRDNDTVRIPISRWPEVKVALEEYNIRGGLW